MMLAALMGTSQPPVLGSHCQVKTTAQRRATSANPEVLHRPACLGELGNSQHSKSGKQDCDKYFFVVIRGI